MKSECKFNPREVADLEGMVEQERQQLPKFYQDHKSCGAVVTGFSKFFVRLFVAIPRMQKISAYFS
jgi:hypothetical protein